MERMQIRSPLTGLTAYETGSPIATVRPGPRRFEHADDHRRTLALHLPQLTLTSMGMSDFGRTSLPRRPESRRSNPEMLRPYRES